jgi:ubiquinol-cytochrome c reductase iron-sulfur subunit
LAEAHDAHDENVNRRDFLYIATGAVAAVGAASFAWPLIHQMNPSAAVLALATVEVDLSAIPEGQQITLMWQGKPIFVRHRTAEDIEKARAVELRVLPDPQSDEERVKPDRDQWLVMIGVCTHLGCVPLRDAGDFGGWFCPCHGSHYDTSGRIRRGPAPENMHIPPYEFLSDTMIRIG